MIGGSVESAIVCVSSHRHRLKRLQEEEKEKVVRNYELNLY